jgi:hypothetical protein
MISRLGNQRPRVSQTQAFLKEDLAGEDAVGVEGGADAA